MTHINDSNRLSEGRDQVDHDYKSHGETTETAELVQKHEFTKVVYGRVDPTPTLRQQDLPVVGRDRVRVSVPHELSLVVREVLQQERRQVTIFTKVQKVLHV